MANFVSLMTKGPALEAERHRVELTISSSSDTNLDVTSSSDDCGRKKTRLLDAVLRRWIGGGATTGGMLGTKMPSLSGAALFALLESCVDNIAEERAAARANLAGGESSERGK